MLVSLDLDQAANPFFLAGSWVKDHVTLGNRTGVNAEEDQFPHVLVGPQLEGQRAELSIVIRGSDHFHSFIICLLPLGGGNLERTGEIVHHCVHQILDPFILEGRPPRNGDHLVRNGGAAHRTLEVCHRDFFLLEKLLTQLVVNVGEGVENLNVSLLRENQLLIIEIHDLEGRTQCIVLGVDHRLLVEHVDLPLELVLCADWDENPERGSSQFLPHLVHHVLKVRPHPVHLVDEYDAGDTVLGSLPPDRLGLRLYASHSAENNNRSVQNTEGTLNFGGKINVSRGVDDVDPLFLFFEQLADTFVLLLYPLTGHGRRGNGDSPLTLLLHMIGSRCTIMHLPDPVNHPGIEENPLGKRRLPGVNMCRNPDIPRPLKRVRSIRAVRASRHSRKCGCSGGEHQICFLPAEVGKGAVGLRHLVNVVALADGSTGIIGGILDFIGKGDVHRGALATTCKSDNPAHCESFGPGGRHLEGNLVCGSTNPTAFHLHPRLGILERPRDHL